jgi:hypothetical protein
MEPDQIYILAFTVLSNLEQIDQTQEARLARQLRSYIGKTDRSDRIHFDFTFLPAVAGAYFDMGAHPDSNTACYIAAADALAKPLGEHHHREFTLDGACFT